MLAEKIDFKQYKTFKDRDKKNSVKSGFKSFKYRDI